MKIWDVKTGKCLRTLDCNCRPYSTVYYLAVIDKMVITGHSHYVGIWNLESDSLIYMRTFECPNSRITCLKVTTDKVITGFENGAVKVWDLKDVAPGQHMDFIYFNEYGNKYRQECYVTNCLLDLKGHSKEVRDIVVAGDKIITCSADHTAKIWDIAKGVCKKSLIGHSDEITHLAVANRNVVTVSNDETIKIWDSNRRMYKHLEK